MSNIGNYAKAVGQITIKTVKGEIEWNKIVSNGFYPMYETIYKNEKLRIFANESEAQNGRIIFQLQIIGKDNMLSGEFHTELANKNLYKAIQAQNYSYGKTEMDNYVKSILEEA